MSPVIFPLPCSSVTPCYLFPKHSTLFNILCLCFGISNWSVLSFRVWWIPIHFKVITFPDLCSLYQSVQLSLSHVRFFATQWSAAHQAFLSRRPSPTPGRYSNSCPLSPWCHPTISSSVVCLLLLLSVFPSIKVFSTKSVLRIRWPKYWSFSFSISPSSEYSGLISFRMDWLDLLAVQGTFKSLQQHSSKASTL